MFQFGVAWSFVWGAKPTKIPHGDRTGDTCMFLFINYSNATAKNTSE